MGTEIARDSRAGRVEPCPGDGLMFGVFEFFGVCSGGGWVFAGTGLFIVFAFGLGSGGGGGGGGRGGIALLALVFELERGGGSFRVLALDHYLAVRS